MSALPEARAHLVKAREFLDAAENNREFELYSAATSSAIIAAINAKDAICLRLTGVTGKSDDHSDAIAELKAAGPSVAGLAPTLSRLLRLRTRAQYGAVAVAAADAAKAIEWATRMVDEAAAVVSD